MSKSRRRARSWLRLVSREARAAILTLAIIVGLAASTTSLHDYWLSFGLNTAADLAGTLTILYVVTPITRTTGRSGIRERRRPDYADVRHQADRVKELIQGFDTSPDIHTIIGVDMSGFGTREEQVQDHLRAALYGRLEKAFRYAGVPWPEQEWREDRGDGALLIVPFNAAAPIIDRLVPHLHAGLRGHNKLSSEEAQITLRMAVHAGTVRRDSYGLSGKAMVEVYRLLDAPAFKDAVSSYRAVLGIVVSEFIYEQVVQRGYGLIDPDSYGKLSIVNKETVTDAWLYLPSRVEAPL